MMEFKKENKYFVLKWKDINQLPESLKEGLQAAAGWIHAGKKLEGFPYNSYIVVNEDEPYAEAVWKLIELSQTEQVTPKVFRWDPSTKTLEDITPGV